MKLVFAGTPFFAVPSLRALHGAGYDICAVLTQPDSPKGRKAVLTPPSVKVAASELGIPVLQPARLKEELEPLRALGADMLITCAYGQILTQEALDIFPLGVWNEHASLLPRYRGAAPIARVIIDGEACTGVTIMKTDVGLDTGDTFLQESLDIADDETSGTLTQKLSLLAAKLIVEAVEKISKGEAVLKKQGEGSTCKKVQRTEVDFSRSARAVSALMRGLSPSPLSFARIGALTLNFYNAAAIECNEDIPYGTVVCASPKEGFVIKCGEGAVSVTQVQPAGGKVMSAKDFTNGRKVEKGQRFEKPVL